MLRRLVMKKNLLLAAILNVILPGSRYLYVEKKWGAAIAEFVISIVGYVIFLLASQIYPIVILFLPVALFIDGLTAAYTHNKKIAKTQP
jgi:hypothetical protein